MPEESLLFDRLSGIEFLEFVGRMYGLPRPTALQRAGELMDLFQLRNSVRLRHSPGEGLAKGDGVHTVP